LSEKPTESNISVSAIA